MTYKLSLFLPAIVLSIFNLPGLHSQPLVTSQMTPSSDNVLLPTLDIGPQLFRSTAVAYHSDAARVIQPLDLGALQSFTASLNNRRYEALKAIIQQRLSATIDSFASKRLSTQSSTKGETDSQNTLSLVRSTADLAGPLGGIGRLLPAQEAVVTIVSSEELNQLQQAGITKKEIDDIAVNYYIMESVFKPVCLVRELLPATDATIYRDNEVWYIKLESRQWSNIREAIGQRLNEKLNKARLVRQQQQNQQQQQKQQQRPKSNAAEQLAIFNPKAFQPHLVVAATRWTPALEQQVGQSDTQCTANLHVTNLR
ncbi:hypothetical protein BDF19DRAFT_466397 [Syncephalis fuscata]|nr:hypothetical protein BDF19DRAFT_466397 [Syncephalis fuscata]